jgi:hypothetical protein
MPNIKPDHIDIWSRNKRLYSTLKQMGIFVFPVLTKNTKQIDHFIVSAGNPDLGNYMKKSI